MAGIQLTAKQIQPLIDKIRPVVDAWAEEMLKSSQERMTRLYKDLKEAAKEPTDEEREACIDYIFKEQRQLRHKWWNLAVYTRQQAERDYVKALARERTKRILIAMTKHSAHHRENDNITPVLNYLEALAKFCDPEALLVLSDNETFQLKKALELYSAKNTDARLEISVP